MYGLFRRRSSRSYNVQSMIDNYDYFVELYFRKPITHKGKKALVNREPKLIENTKQCLFIKGKNTSDISRNCLRDLYQLKKPDGVQLNQKNDILPFENITPLEGFTKKYNASLFAFASHNKKRPHNIVLGRMYDDTLLDMIEMGIESYKGLSEFTSEKISLGIKPCLLFAGPQFDQNSDLKRLQNLLVDFLQRETVNAIRLQGLEHVIMFTADEDKWPVVLALRAVDVLCLSQYS
ncbi:rRNA-binding ribosome biosynthesis protein rpf2 [Homalodisca vitripennis]|nr:rRNA-binding ribosome biosynthesis protein rpf2 [Homalodisca vitripennis]